jgi:hypothetical protein
MASRLMDVDAHRRILAWFYATRRLCRDEYNHLLENVNEIEWKVSECSGKTPFREFAFAHKIAQKSAGRHDCGMLAYRCSRCGSYHIGKKRPKAPRVFKREAVDE